MRRIVRPERAGDLISRKAAVRRRRSIGGMKIGVECYAGYRGEQEPRAFTLGERRFEVAEIVDRWIAPEHRYFKVKADDGRVLVLRQDAASGEWELAGLVGQERPAAGARTVH
jgi:hypothetical protein